jgi:hypothetical protein
MPQMEAAAVSFNLAAADHAQCLHRVIRWLPGWL